MEKIQNILGNKWALRCPAIRKTGFHLLRQSQLAFLETLVNKNEDKVSLIGLDFLTEPNEFSMCWKIPEHTLRLYFFIHDQKVFADIYTNETLKQTAVLWKALEKVEIIFQCRAGIGTFISSSPGDMGFQENVTMPWDDSYLIPLTLEMVQQASELERFRFFRYCGEENQKNLQKKWKLSDEEMKLLIPKQGEE